MKQENPEDLLLKHYRNLHGLSIRQLAAIQENNSAVTGDLIAQKEMIIDQIKSWHESFDISACTAATADKLRQMLTETILNEENSQKLLAERQENVRKRMVANQKSKLIQQAYGNSV